MVHEPGNGLFASPSERVNARVDHEAARAQQGAPDKADPSHRIILIRSQLVRELRGIKAPAFAISGGPAELADKRSEEHTSELQSLMRISYSDFFLQKKKKNKTTQL